MQDKRDMYIGLISFILGSIYTILSFNLPTSVVGSARGHTYLPLAVGIIAAIAGLVLFYKKYKIVKDKDLSEEKAELKAEEKHYKLIFIAIFLSFLYAYFFDKLGYIVSTSLFLGIMLFILRGVEKWISNILIALGFSFFIFYVFGNFLQIYLPTI